MSALRISLKLATRLLEVAITLVVGSYILLGAGLLTLRYAVLPNAQTFVPWMERASTQALGLHVHIGAVQSQWTGLLPTLSLRDLVIDNPQGRPALRFAAVEALPSWKTLPRLQLSFEQLVIRGAQLTITRPDANHLDVGGIQFDLRAPGSGAAQRFADWLVEQDQILIQHSQVTWIDAARGAPPVTLRDVNFELRNTLLRHRAALIATPPAALGAPLELRADLHQPPFLRHRADFSRWHGQFWASWPRVDLGELGRYAVLPKEILGGHGAMQLWVNAGEGYALDSASALVALRGARAELAPALPPLALTQIQGMLGVKPLPGGMQLSAKALTLTTSEGRYLPPLTASFSMQHPAGQPASGSLHTGPLDLQTLHAVANELPMPPLWRARLAQLQPRGHIERVVASWQDARGAPPDQLPARYSLQASFTGLGWNSPAGRTQDGTPPGGAGGASVPDAVPQGDLPVALPGVQQLSGSIRANQSGGQAQLSVRNGAVALPTVFEAADFPVQNLTTALNWSQLPDLQWVVQAAQVQIATPDASGSASFRYTTQAKGPGLLDLTASLERADARAVPQYLPLGIPADVRDYLRSAIAGGSSNDVSFVVHGPLADFPFAESGSGEFSVTAHVTNGVFNAAPRRILSSGEQAQAQSVHENAVWPEFTHINGLLAFTGRSMQLRDASARVFHTTLQGVSLSLADFSKPVLKARGEVRAEAADALRYVHESPLDGMLHHALTHMQATGPVRLNLALDLPLHDLKQTTAKGQLDLLGNEVDYLPTLPMFHGVRGRVDFTDAGFTVNATAQSFLGGPLQLSGGQMPGKSLALNANGTLSAQALQAAPRLAQWADLLRHLQGSTRYSATVGVVQTGQGAQPTVRVQSSLVGMAIDLPPPLGKSAVAPDALHFAQTILVPLGSAPQSIWDIDLDGDLRARFVRLLTPEGPVIQSGGIALGVQADLPQPAQGVQANVHLPLLDVDAWQRALQGSGSAQAAMTGSVSTSNLSGFLPQALSLRVGKLTVSDRVFDDVILGATRSGSLWQANLNSRQVAGYVAWQMGQGDAPGSITARLTHLRLPESADPDVERLLEQQPRSMPALNVIADNVDLHGHRFTRLEARATNREVGREKEWRLDSFSLSAPGGTLSGSGDWVASGPRDGGAGQADGAPAHRMAIGFRLSVQDAGSLLSGLGSPGLLRGGKGLMQGTVSWVGSPLSIDYPTLSGQLRIDLGKGQFLKADPGIAKLLGVLSLQSLPRRLLFNFSDLFESGFAFDKVGADVQLRDGVATTNNFKMSGVSATVFMDGSANLVQETQNLDVVVVPEINAGSASLAYALINPAVGLGTFLAQLIAREPLMKAFTYQYHVTGTWSKPDVRETSGGKPPLPGHPAPAPDAARPGGDGSGQAP